MSEWLGKPRISEDDILKSQPNMAKSFPMLVRYFVDNQKMRITVVLPHDEGDKFRQAVTRAYGSFSSLTINRAAIEALDQWIQKHL